MKTKVLSIFLFGLLAIVMTYCTRDDVITTETPLETVNLNVEDYHFKGVTPAVVSKKGNHVVTKTIKFFDAEGPFVFDYNIVGCSPAPYLSVSGTGNATHLGLYSVVNQGCYDGLNPIFGVITAANGDEIHTYIAHAEQDPDTGIWTYHYKIYDGTGRFEDANGDIFMVGTLDFENWLWKLAGEGTITY